MLENIFYFQIDVNQNAQYTLLVTTATCYACRYRARMTIVFVLYHAILNHDAVHID